MGDDGLGPRAAQRTELGPATKHRGPTRCPRQARHTFPKHPRSHQPQPARCIAEESLVSAVCWLEAASCVALYDLGTWVPRLYARSDRLGRVFRGRRRQPWRSLEELDHLRRGHDRRPSGEGSPRPQFRPLRRSSSNVARPCGMGKPPPLIRQPRTHLLTSVRGSRSQLPRGVSPCSCQVVSGGSGGFSQSLGPEGWVVGLASGEHGHDAIAAPASEANDRSVVPFAFGPFAVVERLGLGRA